MVEDDLAPVLSAVRAADVLVMTSPIYFGQVTGQLKCFIDRTYSFLRPNYMTDPNPSRLAPGKKCVFILTQGDPNEKDYDVFPVYEGFLKWFGYETHSIRGLGMVAATAAAERQDLLKRAEDLARQVVD